MTAVVECKSRRILYEYARKMSYEFADLVNCMNYYYFNMRLSGVLPDGAVGYVKQSLRNITCCAKCNCSKVQSGCSDQHRRTIGSVCLCSFWSSP